MFKYFLQRLAEPSSMAGIAVLGTLLGLPPGTTTAVHSIVAGGVALAAILIPEKS